MKQKLFCLLMLAMVASISLRAQSDNKLGYVLNESFEELVAGALPEGWTQEYIAGHQDWVVEQTSVAPHPAGAADGLNRIALRNNSTQTIGYVTRLITPVMNLEGYFQPVLVLSHAQPQRTGDVDPLKVYYRTSAEGRWIEIADWTKKISEWQTDTVYLTGVSATYQLAFEASDNFGWGVVLDNVQVRSTPTCEAAFDIQYTGLTVSSMTAKWDGSMDAVSFDVVIATSPLDNPDDDNAAVVVRENVETYGITVDTALVRNTAYWMYIRSNCRREQSAWTESRFTTKNLVSDFPYSENFTVGQGWTYMPDAVDFIPYWTIGSNISGAKVPYVNVGTGSNRVVYAYDESFALAFTGEQNLTTPIEKGNYVYAATPELDVNSLSEMQLTFAGTAASFVGADYASGIIVGVMDNPADFTSFVAIDTIYVSEQREYVKAEVRFADYNGTAKYIAFASNFADKANAFYIDNIEIKKAEGAPMPRFSISQVHAGTFTLNVDLNGAKAYNVQATALQVDLSGRVPAEPQNAVQTWNGETDTHKTFTLNDGDVQFLELYVQGVDGDKLSAWAQPQRLHNHKKVATADLPYFITFDETGADNTWTPMRLAEYIKYEVSTQFPASVWTTYQYESLTGNATDNRLWPTCSDHITLVRRYVSVSGSLYGNQSQGHYMVLPEVDNVKDVVLKFYLQRYISEVDITSVYPSKVAVGVMTDREDISTFQKVAEFEGTKDYVPHVVSFADYQGEGKLIAIVAEDAVESGIDNSYDGYHYTTASNIDNVSLWSASACVPAGDVSVETTSTTAVITWQAVGMKEWHVTVKDAADNVLKDVTVSEAKLELADLEAAADYKVMVTPVCDTELQSGDWITFRTECPVYTVPYVMDFSAYEASSSAQVLPFCWYAPEYVSTYIDGKYSVVYNYYYPTVNGSGSNKQFAFGYPGRDLNYVDTNTPERVWFTLPELNEDISKLQVSLWLSGTEGEKVQVGVMTDETDLTTFRQITSFTLTKAEKKEYIISLGDYSGTSEGKHIAFLKDDDLNVISVSSLSVDVAPACEKVLDVTTSDETPRGAKVSWAQGKATEWQIVATAEAVDMEQFDLTENAAKVLYNEKVSTNPAVIALAGAKDNTVYYVYVRAVCGEGVYGEWSTAVAFRTACGAITPEAYGTETFGNKDALYCWTVGMRQKAENTTYAQNDPYIRDYSNPWATRYGQHLYFYNSDINDGAYAIMPELDVDDISQYQISFDMLTDNEATNNVASIRVGIISDLDELATFVNLQTVKATYAADTTGFQRYTVRFSNYTGDNITGKKGKNVMFLSETGDKKNSIVIDNISFAKVGSCKEPLEVKIDSIGDYEAKVVWENTGAEQYVVAWTADGKQNPDDIATTTTVTTNSAIINGLLQNTYYYVYVRSVCGEEHSIWSNAKVGKTTHTGSYELPFYEDFTGYGTGSSSTGLIPTNWTQIRGHYIRIKDNASYDMNLSYITSSYSRYCLLLATQINNTTYSVDKLGYVILPMIADDLSKAIISFNYRGNSTTSQFMYGIADDNELTNVQWLDTITCTGTSSTVLKPYLASMSKYKGAGHYVVFATLPVANIGCYIYDLKIESVANELKEPLYLSSSNEMLNSVDVAWSSYYPADAPTGFEVTYVPQGAGVAATPDVIFTTTDQNITLTGLQPSTAYDVYVRAIYPTGISEWSEPLTINTLCSVSAEDAFWNFDDDELYAAGVYNGTNYYMPNCWMAGTTYSSASYQPYVVTNVYTEGYSYSVSSYSGDRALYFNGTYKPYAVLPYIDADMDTMQVHFKARVQKVSGTTKLLNAQSGARTIKVGYMTNPYDHTTIKNIDSYELAVNTETDPSKDPNQFWEDVAISLYGAGKGNWIVLYYEGTTSNTIYIDDVRVEKETGCYRPGGLELEPTTLNYRHADFKWTSQKEQFNIRLMKGDEVVIETSVNGHTYSTDALEGSTDYSFSVQAVCGDDVTAWNTITFTTPCDPLTKEQAYWNFDDEAEFLQIGTTGIGCGRYGCTGYQISYMLNCVNYGYYDKNSSDPTKWAYKAGGDTRDYIRITYAYDEIGYDNLDNCYGTPVENGGRSLMFATQSVFYDSYIVLQDLDFSLQGKVLHFFGRAASFYNNDYTSRPGGLSYGNSNYSRILVLGYVDDVEDFTTFHALDTISYDKVWTEAEKETVTLASDPSGKKWWQEYVVKLDKYDGKHVAIMAPYSASHSEFYVDEMMVTEVIPCMVPSGLHATDITTNSALLSWYADEDANIEVEVATTNDFKEGTIVKTFTSTESSQVLSDLPSSATYYARARRICAADDLSEWSATYQFATLYTVRFDEKFEERQMLPNNWERYVGSLNDVVDQDSSFVASRLTSPSSRYHGDQAWRRSDVDFGMTAGHMVVNTSVEDVFGDASGEFHWLISPVIDLSDVASTDSLMLSFDVLVTGATAAAAVGSTSADVFAVAVSTDGNTWPSANVVRFAGQTYRDFTKQVEKVYVEMSQYRGQQIRIAFYSGSPYTMSRNLLHLDNVVLNTSIRNEYQQTVCRWEDYEDDNFSVDADDLKVGQDNVFEKFVASADASDVYHILHLTVVPDTTINYAATVCEDRDYKDYNFDIHTLSSGIYKQKLERANGCDSVVVLDLNVLPTLRQTVEQTICQGTFYTFNNVDYYANTIHSDTLQSAVTECDSIVTLYLTVTPALSSEEEVWLCPETDYYFTPKYPAITEAGVYSDTTVNSEGCDVVETLTVYKAESASSFTRVAICAGETYSDGDVFRGLGTQGDYVSKQQTVHGCDSIVTLRLLVAGTEDGVEFNIVDSISIDDLPYVINGETLLEEAETDQLYVRTVNLGCGEVNLTIVVGNPVTGLNSVFRQSLAVAPNPVHVGEPVRVLTPFSASQIAGLTVEVYDGTGALVSRKMPKVAPIVIDPLPIAGVYMVRISTGTETYQAKLVVK